MKALNNAFLFIFLIFLHNNNGGFMKKFFLVFFTFFLFCSNVLGVLYVSKKDIDTNDFVNDCDFLLYDSSGNIVDEWTQGNGVHVSNISNGIYKLVEKPIILGDLDINSYESYDLKIDGVLEVILYNQKIETPRNLNFNNSILYGFVLLFFGFILIIFSRKFNYL